MLTLLLNGTSSGVHTVTIVARTTTNPSIMATGEPTDQELVAAANRGDEAAFAGLVRRYIPLAQKVALRILAGRPDSGGLAEDAVQDALVEFAGMFPGFPSTGLPGQTVFKLAVRAARGLRDKDRRRRERAANVDPPAPPSAAADPFLRDILRAVVASLSEPLRDVFVLRFRDFASEKEIAEALEIPVGTVKSRLHLAVKALREDRRLKDLLGE